MDLKELFIKLKNSKENREEREKTDEAMLEKFLGLMSSAFQFEHGALSAEKEKELLDSKGFIEKMDSKLRKQDGVKELTFIYDADAKIDRFGKIFRDYGHPQRQDTGSYIVHVPTNYAESLESMAAERKVKIAAEPPREMTKEEKIESGIFQYICDNFSIQECAKACNLSVVSFELELKKTFKDRQKMQGLLGNNWRSMAENRGWLKEPDSRAQLINNVGVARMEGLTVCAIAKKFKVKIGLVTSILGYYRNQGHNWLYTRFFPEYGAGWEAKSIVGFDHRLYMVGVHDEYIKDGGSEAQFAADQIAFEFDDGYILA